jgi:import inner membrane translocase subunit TIM50
LIGLDKYGTVQHRLFKEHLTWKDGHFLKDLNRMNRDLSKVILIDDDENSFKWHPENGVVIPSWSKDPNDKELLAVKAFLLGLVRDDVKDVREVIRSLGNKDTAKQWLDLKRKKIESRKKPQKKQTPPKE